MNKSKYADELEQVKNYEQGTRSIKDILDSKTDTVAPSCKRTGYSLKTNILA